MSSEHPLPPAGEAGYERRDTRVGPVVVALVALAGAVALALLVAAWIVGGLEQRAAGNSRVRHPMQDFRTEVPGPRLQARPALEIEEHRGVEALQVGSYGWIDPGQGVLRIPVERARELVLRDGLSRPSAGGAQDPEQAPAESAGTELEVPAQGDEEGG